MNLDALCETLNRELIANQHRPLNPAETLLLRGIWQFQTYSQIAEEVGYSPGYLTNVVAPELLHRLSQLTGQRLTKKNCRIVLESFTASQPRSNSPVPPSSLPSQTQRRQMVSLDADKNLAPAFPSGSIAANSPFYIERPPIEKQVCEEILKPGALVRIKAPKQMGKTSLMLRTLDDAQQRGYRTVCLNLAQMDQAICADLNRFLRGLCVSATRQLQLEPKLDDYWDEDIGSKVSCTLYFRNHLLEQIDRPIVLALDELNQIFEYPQVAKDVLPLLRSWYEEAKRVPIWQNLRLIIAHSTEVYVPLQLNQSPFNVGLATQLHGFNLQQVQQLAQRYELDWGTEDAAQQLTALVGGHPALIHTAIYHLSRHEYTLDQLLETAATTMGIYHHHLRCHLATLKQQPALVDALHQLLVSNQPVHLESTIAYQLYSLGLINLSANEATLSCKLYQQYFRAML